MTSDLQSKQLESDFAFDVRRKEYEDLGWWPTLAWNTVPARWLLKDEQRLDGRSYSQEAATALRVIETSDLEIRRLSNLVEDIFVLGRFRRIYATNVDSGWPYLSASEVFDFRPKSERWLAKAYAPNNAEKHFVESGWVLVSASGTVGRTTLATKRLEDYFLTHDLLRLVPLDFPPPGYLYAYLSSWIGQALMARDQYGSAIKHLEPHQLARVPVPLVSDNEQYQIHDQVMKAYALRDQANNQLDQADDLIHSELGLPRFDESLVRYLSSPGPTLTGPEIPHPRAFTIPSSSFSDRLDASYHIPVARTAIELLFESKYQPVNLAEIVEYIRIPPRFKRIYVSEQHGVPFLRPSHMPQVRPHDLGYISRLTEVLDSLLLHKGEVMVTTDGTIGRIAVVTSQTDGWAGSNNIARIAYTASAYSNGYLAAFLRTPYGYHQLAREIYGGVVDHIDQTHIGSVVLPMAPDEIKDHIGKLVVDAFEKKDEATNIEKRAISMLETRLGGEKKVD